VQQLRFKNVGSHGIYIDRLHSNYGFEMKTVPFDTGGAFIFRCFLDNGELQVVSITLSRSHAYSAE
jgi:hypothetical protein